MTPVAAHALQVTADAERSVPLLRPAVRIPRPEEWIAEPALNFTPAAKAPARPAPNAGRESDLAAVERKAFAATTLDSFAATTLDSFAEATAASNALLVTVDAPGSEHKNGLARFVNERIEARLISSGAAARGPDVPTNLSDVLADQLYRARLLGLDGLGLAFKELKAISEAGLLSPTDSRTLRWWLAAEAKYPVSLYLSEQMRGLCVYPAPVRLGGLCSPAASEPRVQSARPRGLARQASPAQIELPFAEGLRRELRQECAPSHSPRPADGPDPGSPAPERSGPARRRPRTAKPTAEAAPESSQQSEGSHVRRWREALADSSGVQTWETLETQFVANYLPLLHARMSEQADERADAVLSTWSEHFQQGYEEAYSKLCRYSQRPQMIFDLPQIAFNLARQFESPKVRLVLVDGLRFDLGQRVHDKLRLQMTGVGQCVQRGVTWSSMPCDTAAQLELLARGADGLRSELGTLDIPELVATGAGARKLRPLRSGPHQLLKLDALQPLLCQGKAWGPAALEQAAAEVAFSVGRFLKQQADNTLTLVFGDHGFDLQDSSSQRATPENILVPYDAWLLGD